MKLYFLRHATAAERDADKYPDESLRPLTKTGRKKMNDIAEAISKMDLRVDIILSSPFVRAYQSANIVCKQLHMDKELLILTDQLAPLGDFNQLVLSIKLDYPVDNLLLVGHEPELSELISLLLSGGISLAIAMKKGSICCLSVDELADGKCASLEWLLTPSQLEML